MKFKVYNGEFPLVLIRASAVRDIFNQQDLASRQNADLPLLDKYHENWIHNNIMLVPSFFIIDNEAKVGMGHHRFTMLSRHMKLIPAAFEQRFSKSNDLENILARIVVREMTEYEEFEYPDFPIEDLGPDVNGGKDWKNYL
jgi:hypothetical protein